MRRGALTAFQTPPKNAYLLWFHNTLGFITAEYLDPFHLLHLVWSSWYFVWPSLTTSPGYLHFATPSTSISWRFKGTRCRSLNMIYLEFSERRICFSLSASELHIASNCWSSLRLFANSTTSSEEIKEGTYCTIGVGDYEMPSSNSSPLYRSGTSSPRKQVMNSRGEWRQPCPSPLRILALSVVCPRPPPPSHVTVALVAV